MKEKKIHFKLEHDTKLHELWLKELKLLNIWKTPNIEHTRPVCCDKVKWNVFAVVGVSVFIDQEQVLLLLLFFSFWKYAPLNREYLKRSPCCHTFAWGKKYKLSYQWKYQCIRRSHTEIHTTDQSKKWKYVLTDWNHLFSGLMHRNACIFFLSLTQQP